MKSCIKTHSVPHKITVKPPQTQTPQPLAHEANTQKESVFSKSTKKAGTLKNAHSPNALITSNRIPAKADLQSPSHAPLRLCAPLLFPADFCCSRRFESLPAIFW